MEDQQKETTAPSKSNKRRLKSFYINPDFQSKLMLIFGSIGLLQSALYYYAIYFSFQQIESIGRQSELEETHMFYTQLANQEFFVMSFLGVTFLISLGLFLFLGFRFSHRTAGSMYRMRIEFEKMKEDGVLRHFHLRKTDFFRDVEQAFNDLVDTINKK